MGFQQSFKALSDPVRREILSLLRRGPMAAGDIAAHFELSGATVSHHLAILRDAGLILDDRQGKYIYYELGSLFDGPIPIDRADAAYLFRVAADGTTMTFEPVGEVQYVPQND